MLFPRELRPGQDPRKLRNWLNDLLAVAQSQRIEKVSGPLGFEQSAEGYGLVYRPVLPIRAKLSGATSPYSFQQVFDDTGGASTRIDNGYTGTNNAYEVNNVGGLDGMVVDDLYHSTVENTWKFQWIAAPGTHNPPGTCPGCPGVTYPPILHYSDTYNSQNGVAGFPGSGAAMTFSVDRWTALNHFHVPGGTPFFYPCGEVDVDGNCLCEAAVGGVTIVQYELFCVQPGPIWGMNQYIPVCAYDPSGLSYPSAADFLNFGLDWVWRIYFSQVEVPCTSALNLTFNFTDPNGLFVIPRVIVTL